MQSVGGAVITGNKFVGGEQLIRARGTYDNSQFNWQSYWNDNTFERAAVTLVGTSLPVFDVRTYSYPGTYGTFNNVRSIGALVQPEIVNAVPDDTILVGSGLYAENLVVDKQVKLVGAGSGSDPTTNTVLRPATGNVVTITGSGVSDGNPLLLKSLRIEPQGTVGINLGNTDLLVPQTMSYIRLEDVQVVGTPNQAHIEDERGINLDLNKSVAHLVVVNSGFSQCDHGWYFTKHNGATFTPNTAQYISVSNSSFVDNSYKGIYVEMLSDATFENVVVTNNGQIANWNGRWNAGFDINLKGDTTGQTRSYQNLVFRNMTMIGNGLGARDGTALAIKVRDDGSYTPYPAALNGVLVDGGIFTGNERGIRVGEPTANNAGPSNVQIHGAAIYSNRQFYTDGDGSLYGGVVNHTQTIVDATNNWWGAANGPSGDGTGNGDAVRHAVALVLFNPFLMSTPAGVDSARNTGGPADGRHQLHPAGQP